MRAVGITVFFVLLARAATAQDQQLGARTKAMGGSYTAFEDDPISVWLNPAGISTQPDQGCLAYQTYTAYPVKQNPGPGGSTLFSVAPKTIFADPAIIPSYLGAVFQIGSAESPMALGICIARPYLLKYAMDQITSASQTVFDPQNDVEESMSRFRVAFAKDFRLAAAGESAFFTHIAVGLGVDVGYERWEFRSPTTNTTDSASSMGFGAGLLACIYEDINSLKINIGLAYSSAIHYGFSIDPSILPAFDMPEQVNVGVTGYFLKGLPLRTTFDVQFIAWKATAESPLFAGQPHFENAVNYSFGAEYRVKVSDQVSLYPRAGYRRFDAPWSDKDNLPSTGRYKLVLDTKAEVFNIFTYGIGIAWNNDAGKVRSIDLAGDLGGDSINVALGLNYEF